MSSAVKNAPVMAYPDKTVRVSRRWLVPAGLLMLVCSFIQAPGKISPDTKLDLTIAPGHFLSRALNLWSSELPFGQVQNQAYGYLFPHGSFFWIAHRLGFPGWVTQRLWWALLMLIGFWGIIRLAEALHIGTLSSRFLAGFAFAWSPRALSILGAISSEMLPMMLSVWVLIPIVQLGNVIPEKFSSPRRLAAQSGWAIALMGAVNAVATVAAMIPAIIWWGCYRPNRRWWNFTGWVVVSLICAITWWVIPLLILGKVSPPFLEFIESSGVTTRWDCLVELLRGTHSWTPFVAPHISAGTPLVTQPVLILGTCLVAGAGFAGISSLTYQRHGGAGRLVIMLLVGVVIMAVGYSGKMGSPWAYFVQHFLDARGAPLRNVHKFDSTIRIPLCLGIAEILGKVPLPGSAPALVWQRAFIHPERHRSAAIGIVIMTALLVSTSLVWTARLAPPGTFRAIPSYWYQAAYWLQTHNHSWPQGRVLVAPGSPFATQLWGTTHDEPFQVLNVGPWGVRDSIPLTPPQTIRALDSVQQLFAAGVGSPALGIILARQGISYLLIRNDLDPETSRSARPILIHRSLDHSGGIHRVAEFGHRISLPTVPGFIWDNGLQLPYRAIEIYQVDTPVNPAAPYLVDLESLPRIDGGPEVLARLETHHALLGLSPLGPAVLTADAQQAGIPIHRVRITDTPLAREVDYGRVDYHSSAVQSLADPRRTRSRLPDYPVPGASLVFGGWIGGRLSVSSSSSDATALPDVIPAASPALAIDGDPTTGWVSNALQPALGQWLQVDLDHPVTNATITLIPSATALGAQVNKIQISTAHGTTTAHIDHPGQPLTAALPYGETSWVRITAAGTEDGSPGVQFGITELSLTHYDAQGNPHRIDLRHTIQMPAPPSGAEISLWDFGHGLEGRPECVRSNESLRCSAAMMLAPEEPTIFSRTLQVPSSISVDPTVWVVPRLGPHFTELFQQTHTLHATGEANLLDERGSVYAAIDADPSTSWVAPQTTTHHQHNPTITLRLPQRTEVSGLQIQLSSSPVPTHPTLIAVNLGDGPQIRSLADQTNPQQVLLHPFRTDTIRLSILDWHDLIDRTALGFDQLKPSGLSEITILDHNHHPVFGVEEQTNRHQPITIDCNHGPIINVAGRTIHTSIHTTLEELLDHHPLLAQPCSRQPIVLPAGIEELLIDPQSEFSVYGARLTRHDTALSSPQIQVLHPQQWNHTHRRVQIPFASSPRIIVIPESTNPGWIAHDSHHRQLHPIIINGWQQGWIIPAGYSGELSLDFWLNSFYRWGLFGGLTLLVLLAALLFWPPSKFSTQYSPPTSWSAPTPLLLIGASGFSLSVCGVAGLLTCIAAVGLLVFLLRDTTRSSVYYRLYQLLSSGGIIIAGMRLAQHPWHSIHGYAGHSAALQWWAFVSLATLIALSVAPRLSLKH